MSRSAKKGYYVNEKLLKKVIKIKQLPEVEKEQSVIKTWSRDSTVVPEMIGINFDIHNGKTFTRIKIIEDMVGHKLGEFSLTRKFIKHGGKLQREQETKAAK
jgi:small subunit ribosomal protein S19